MSDDMQRYQKVLLYLQRVAGNLRAGCDELVALSEQLSDAGRDRLLRSVNQLESCFQRAHALAAIAALGSDPDAPKEGALDAAELHGRIRDLIKDLRAAADSLNELAKPPDKTPHWVN